MLDVGKFVSGIGGFVDVQHPRFTIIRVLGKLFRQIVCVVIIGLIAAVYIMAIHVNVTTTALTFLLAVLLVATTWGLAEAVTTSIAAVLAFNYFFLPPVGEFTIEDPQNWVALIAFLVTATTGSQLSARAKRRTLEAQR